MNPITRILSSSDVLAAVWVSVQCYPAVWVSIQLRRILTKRNIRRTFYQCHTEDGVLLRRTGHCFGSVHNVNPPFEWPNERDKYWPLQIFASPCMNPIPTMVASAAVLTVILISVHVWSSISVSWRPRARIDLNQNWSHLIFPPISRKPTLFCSLNRSPWNPWPCWYSLFMVHLFSWLLQMKLVLLLCWVLLWIDQLWRVVCLLYT